MGQKVKYFIITTINVFLWQRHQQASGNHITYHIAARRISWCDPPPKIPRNLLLGMGSQRIIIMAWSNHKIKPIQVKSWMLYLKWASQLSHLIFLNNVSNHSFSKADNIQYLLPSPHPKKELNCHLTPSQAY